MYANGVFVFARPLNFKHLKINVFSKIVELLSRISMKIKE